MQQFATICLPAAPRRRARSSRSSKEHALLNMSGSPNRILPLPQIAVAHEDYACSIACSSGHAAAARGKHLEHDHS